jgi:transcription antitermination factor NusG
MSKSYTPGLKILEKTSIKKERILPLKGKVHVNQGESVDADSVVASTKIPGNLQMINIANKLNIDADEVSDCMLCAVDENIKKGQIIARSKGLFGFFKTEVKSPLDGMIGNISDVTGQVIISEKPYPIEIDAYIPGEINSVIDKEGVIVSSYGMLIQGIIGIGGEKKGYIKTINNEEINSDQNINNKIIIIKSNLTYDFYKKLNKLGVQGVVCGGIDYNTLTKILKKPLGVAITGMEETITIIVTEGFGDILMADRTYQLLHKNNEQFASINGATQIRAGVMRPEIFIGSNSGSKSFESFDEESLVISVGSKVRIIRNPYFGEIGRVVELPSELVKIDTETTSRVAEIELKNGEKAIIPRANLEVILSD